MIKRLSISPNFSPNLSLFWGFVRCKVKDGIKYGLLDKVDKIYQIYQKNPWRIPSALLYRKSHYFFLYARVSTITLEMRMDEFMIQFLICFIRNSKLEKKYFNFKF